MQELLQDCFLNKKVIVVTSDGCAHFGILIDKSRKEVILRNSRRLKA